MKINNLFNKFISLTVSICLLVSITSADAFSAVKISDNSQVTNEDMPLVSLDNGKITSVNDTGSNLTVVNIQDLHCHKETQKKISNIIEEINKENKIKEIYVEGGYGKIDVSWLNKINDKKIKEQIIEQLLEDGEITAGEYYATLKNSDVELKGLDEKITHQQNLERLSQIMDNQEKYATVISKVRNEIARLNKKYINYENRKFSEKIKQYKSEGGDSGKLYIKLFKYIDKINENFDKYNNITKIVKENYPNMATYILLDKESKKIKPEEIGEQIKAILTDLKAVLSYSEYSDIITKTNNLKDINKLAWYINKYTTEKNIDLSKYGSLGKFLEIRKLTAGLNPVKLLEEERDLIEQIRYALSYNKTEYEIAYISDFEEYFEKYLKYGLTSKDWHFAKKGFNKFRQLYAKYAVIDRIKEIEKDFVELDKYYNINDERNSIFVNNILDEKFADKIKKPQTRTVKEIIKDSKEVIIVVAGGYHSDELSNMLSEKSVNDIVITPNITGDIEKASNKYKQTIKEQAVLQSQALAFRLASCSSENYQKRVLLKAGVESLGNNVNAINKLSELLNIKINYDEKEKKIEFNNETISLGDDVIDKEKVFYNEATTAIGAAIEHFNAAVELFDSKNFKMLYDANVNKFLFVIAKILSDSGGSPSIKVDNILHKGNLQELEEEFAKEKYFKNSEIEEFVKLSLATQDKIAESSLKKQRNISNAITRIEEKDKIDIDAFITEYKEKNTVSDKEEKFLKEALESLNNGKLFGVDIKNFNINKDMLSFVVENISDKEFTSNQAYQQLIFVDGLKIKTEQQKEIIISLSKELKSFINPAHYASISVLSVENGGLAIKLLLNDIDNKIINDDGTIADREIIFSEYNKYSKLSRNIRSLMSDEDFNTMMNIIDSDNESAKQQYYSIFKEHYKKTKKEAQNKNILDKDTDIFAYFGYSKLDWVNTFQNVGIMGLIDELLINAYRENKEELIRAFKENNEDEVEEIEKQKGQKRYNYSKGRWEQLEGKELEEAVNEEIEKRVDDEINKKIKSTKEKMLENFFGFDTDAHFKNFGSESLANDQWDYLVNKLKNTEKGKKNLIYINTHGSDNDIELYSKRIYKGESIYVSRSIDDFVDIVKILKNNNINLEDVTLVFDSCHSHRFATNLYKKLEEEGLGDVNIISSTNPEHNLGFPLRNGYPISSEELYDGTTLVSNLMYSVLKYVREDSFNNGNITLQDFSNAVPNYAIHSVFMAGSNIGKINNDISKKLHELSKNLKSDTEGLYYKSTNTSEILPGNVAELSIRGDDEYAPVWEELVFGTTVTALLAVFMISNPFGWFTGIVAGALFVAARLGFMDAHRIYKNWKYNENIGFSENIKTRLFPTTILSVPYAIVLFGGLGTFLPALAVATGIAMGIHWYWNNNEEEIKFYLSKIPFIKNLSYIEMNILREESKYKDDVDVLENSIKNNQIENVTARAKTDSYSSPIFMSLNYKGKETRYYQEDDEDTGKYNISQDLDFGVVINLSIADFAILAGNDLNNFSYALTYFFNRASYQYGPTILDKIEGLDDEYKEQVLYFLYECFKNAYYHGNKLDTDQPVYIWLEKSKTGLTFKVANKVNDIQRDGRLEEKAEMIGITGKGAAHNKMNGWSDTDDNIIFEAGETLNGKYYVSSFTIINKKEKEKVINTVKDFSKDFKNIYEDEYVFTSIQGGGFVFKEIKKPKMSDSNREDYRNDLKELEDMFLSDDRFYEKKLSELYEKCKMFGIPESELKHINYIRVMQNKEDNDYLIKIINNKDFDAKVRLLAYGYFMKNGGNINDYSTNLKNLKENLEDLKYKTKDLLSKCVDDTKINEKEIENDVDLRAVGVGVALMLLDEKYEISGVQNSFIKLSKGQTQKLYKTILNSNIVKHGDAGTAPAYSSMFFADISIETIAHEIGHNIFDIKKNNVNINPTLNELAADVSASMLMQILGKDVIKNVSIKDYANKLFKNGEIRNGIEFSFLEEHDAAKGLIFLLFTTINRYLGREMLFSEFFMVLLEVNAQTAGYTNFKIESQSVSLVNIINIYTDWLGKVYGKDKDKIIELKKAIKETDSWKIVVPEIIRSIETKTGKRDRNLYDFITDIIESFSPQESYKIKYNYDSNIKRIKKELDTVSNEQDRHLIIYNSLLYPSNLSWLAYIIEKFLNTLSDEQIETVTLKVLEQKGVDINNLDVNELTGEQEKELKKIIINLPEEEKRILVKLIIVKEQLSDVDELILWELLKDKGISSSQINEWIKNKRISSLDADNKGGAQKEIRILFDIERANLSYDERNYVMSTIGSDENNTDILDVLNEEQEMVIKLKTVSTVYNKIEGKFVTSEDVYETVNRILKKISKDETINEKKLDNEIIVETLEEVISEGYKKDQNSPTAALLPENKNNLINWIENNIKELSFTKVLKKSFEMALDELSPSLSLNFIRRHFEGDKRTAERLQAATVASAVISALTIGIVLFWLNPIASLTILVRLAIFSFSVPAITVSINMIYHTSIIYKFIKGTATGSIEGREEIKDKDFSGEEINTDIESSISDFKTKFEDYIEDNGFNENKSVGKIIVSEKQNSAFGRVGFGYTMEDILSLKYKGVLLYVDFKEQPTEDKIEHLKKTNRAGYRYNGKTVTFKEEPKIQSVAMVAENKNKLLSWVTNNFEQLNRIVKLKTSLKFATDEFSPSLYSNFKEKHYAIDKQSANNLQKVTLASSVIFGILGVVSVALNPVLYIAIPVIFMVAALISGTNIAYHTIIIYKYINSIEELKKEYGNLINIEADGEILLPVYITDNIEKFIQEKETPIPVGVNTKSGYQIYKLNRDGLIILGTANPNENLKDMADSIDGSAIDKKIKGVNVDKIIVDNELKENSVEFANDGAIRISETNFIGMSYAQQRQYIKEISKAKQTEAITLADNRIFSLTNMDYSGAGINEVSHNVDDFKTKLENGQGLKIISSNQAKGSFITKEYISNLKAKGIYVYVEFDNWNSNLPTSKELEVLKNKGIEGYVIKDKEEIIKKDIKVWDDIKTMVTFGLQENVKEGIKLTIPRLTTIEELQEDIIESETPVVIDVVELEKLFENNENKFDACNDFYKLFTSMFVSFKNLSRKNVVETAYNISFADIPIMNINDEINEINWNEIIDNNNQISILYSSIEDDKKTEFEEIIKYRILAKNIITELNCNYTEQNREVKKLEKLLIKNIKEQNKIDFEKIKSEKNNIKEIVENTEKTLEQNKIDLWDNLTKQENAEDAIAIIAIIIDIIADENKVTGNIDKDVNNMAQDYRAMLAAA